MPSQIKIPTFPWPGGKAALSTYILQHIPKQGRKFIDLFAGRGNIILRALYEELEYEQWIVNDILTAPFFRALQSHGGTFIAGNKVHAEYDRCAELKKQGDPYALLMEPWLCYNGGTYEDNSLRGDGGGKRSAESHTRHVRMAHKLLCEKNVKITALDWLDCLKSVELTSDDSVTMDMPYIGSDPGAYSSESVCPTEVIEQLRNAPYRWAFCEYPQPLYFATLGEPVYKKEVQLRATMLRHVRETRTECLWVGGKSSPSVTVTLPTPVPEGRNDAYYKSLSVEGLLKEIQECIGAITYHRNQMNREMRERLLPALLELRKRTYRKKPGFYVSLAKIGLNADTVRQWFYRSNTADEAIELIEETPAESVMREHRDGQSPEELLLEHADRMAKAILAGKLMHAKKLASQYLETRNEGQVRTEPEAA